MGQDYFGLPSPSEVINAHGGICPRCKHDLRRPNLKDIKINIARGRKPLTLDITIHSRVLGTGQEVLLIAPDKPVGIA